jgi:hypothetical protein
LREISTGNQYWNVPLLSGFFSSAEINPPKSHLCIHLIPAAPRQHARPSDRVSMPSSSSSVAGAKGRSKTALGPGYSLMAWMRLSQGADLSGGVGAIDPDEDEAKWKEWDVR